MAGLDTSIPLGIRPVDFGDPNEGRMNALRAQMMQMQMQQGQFNMMKAQRDMQYQDQQRARAAAEAARQKAKEEAARRDFMTAYGATGNVNVPIPAQVAEPGAASDVGMMGSQNAMPEYKPSSMMMTQPKDLRAATNALIQGGNFDAANFGMGYGNAVTEAEKKDVELRKAKTEASSSEAKAIDENLKPFRAYAAAVNSPEAAAAYVSAMFDHPVLGTMAQKVSGQTKDQAIAAAVKDYTADPQRWMAAHVGLTGEQVMKVLSGGNEFPPLKPADKFKIEQGLNKSYSTATTILDTLEDAHDALQNVQGSNIAGTTGISAYIPSMPGGAAATAENRMKTLEGKVTALGKASAASTGAIGSIATQEWKILREMVASLDPSKGEKAYREQLDNVEAQLQGAKNRIRDAYEKAHVDTLKRPEFQQYGALPEPRERGGVMPGSNPVAQAPVVNRVRPNTPGGGRVPAGGAGTAPTNTKGWVLHTDANGNKAYVSPDGKSFEEVK
jgi:hypothetical protein